MIVGMQPTLLIGPADWDPSRLPREEYSTRLAALWENLPPEFGGAVIFGDPADHAELAYYTHFTPKLEPAIALVPRQGDIRLLVGGGVNMLPAAKPLTFVEDLAALRDVGPTVARWVAELGAACVLINGAAMPFAMRRGLATALGHEPAEHSPVAAMRRPSGRERDLLRAGCDMLQAGIAAMAGARGATLGLTDTVLAGEHAAFRRGAQDVRTLFGRDGHSFGPFVVPIAEPADRLHVHLAIRHDGYWVEGFAALGASRPAERSARAALDRAIALIRPGVAVADLERTIAADSGAHPHPVATPCCRALGLSILPSGERIEQGGVYSIRAGAADSFGTVVSAVVAVTDAGADLWWSSPQEEP